MEQQTADTTCAKCQRVIANGDGRYRLRIGEFHPECWESDVSQLTRIVETGKPQGK
jgi:hypothetical protein